MKVGSFEKRVVRTAAYGVLAAMLPICCAAANSPSPLSLDQGFHLLYNLDFAGAHEVFVGWQHQHPENPLGPTCEAAGLLFSEFHRLGVLEGQFYEDDEKFESRKKLDADPALRDAFNRILDGAEKSARSRLAKDPKDRDALFSMTLGAGLRSDYAALIEKRSLASLGYGRAASEWAAKLLVVDPNCYDAHLATGVNNYIIGSMAAPVRWVLRLGGVAGDKKLGIANLQLTAERGQYLAPLARIMLAIVYVREKDSNRARELLASLRDEFPGNALFAQEIARLARTH